MMTLLLFIVAAFAALLVVGHFAQRAAYREGFYAGARAALDASDDDADDPRPLYDRIDARRER